MGIRYESNQERLPLILANAASVIGQVLPKLPDLISREDVLHFQGKRRPSSSSEIASSTAVEPYLFLSSAQSAQPRRKLHTHRIPAEQEE
jgi:hypothetical protein